MIETMVICAIFGSIIGSCATIILILLLMAACPNTPQKMREDWMGLKEWVAKKKPKRKFKIVRHKGKHWHSAWYYYLLPKRITLKCNPPLYKWLIWIFDFRRRYEV